MIYGDARSTTFLLLLSGAAVAIIAFVHQWWADRARPAPNSYKPSSSSSHLLVLGLNALVASALTFGPVSITTGLLDRYLVAPVVLGLMAVVALTLNFFKPLTGWRRVAALGFLVLVVGLNIWRAEQSIDSQFAARLRTHNAVSELVEREGQRWSANAQVVMLTGWGYTSPTLGFNHWSTWYLR